MNRLAETLDRWMNRIKLQPKLMITFCIISIVPLAITAAFFYFILNASLEEEVGTSMVQTTKQVDERLSSFTGELMHLTKVIQFDADLQAFLEWKSPSDLSKIPNLQSLRNLISNIVHQNANLRGIYAINDHGRFIHDDKDMIQLEYDFLADPWYQEVVKADKFRLLPAHRQNYAQGASVVTFAGRVFKVSDLKLGGTLLFDYDSRFIANMIENIRVGQSGKVFILSPSGESVVELQEEDSGRVAYLSSMPELNERQQGYYLTTVEQVQMLVGFSTSTSTGWKVVAVVPFQEVSGKIDQMKVMITILLLAAVLAILLFARFLSRAINRPMRRLAGYMKQVETGDLTIRVPNDRGDEFGLLGSRFNHMLDKLQELEDVLYLSEIRETRLQLLNRESELKALQMQINPHFLYNTLNTMKLIGEIHEIKEVAVMSEGLSDMFKYSIDSDKYKTLREEIEHVKAYVHIIQTRYPERIHCHFDIPEELENEPILKLILQPLVENAIEHGLIPKASGGNIWISTAYTDSQQLALIVKDDGVGISHSRMEQLRNKLNGSGPSSEDLSMRGHVGLFNVSQRLALNYGSLGQLFIYSNEPSGTIVEVRLPLDEIGG